MQHFIIPDEFYVSETAVEIGTAADVQRIERRRKRRYRIGAGFFCFADYRDTYTPDIAQAHLHPCPAAVDSFVNSRRQFRFYF